jgi:hypothetical protein
LGYSFAYMPTADVALILAGFFLVLVGLTSGGVKSQYVTVQRVIGRARVLAVVLGVLMIVAGIGLAALPSIKDQPTKKANPQPQEKQEPPENPAPQPKTSGNGAPNPDNPSTAPAGGSSQPMRPQQPQIGFTIRANFHPELEDYDVVINIDDELVGSLTKPSPPMGDGELLHVDIPNAGKHRYTLNCQTAGITQLHQSVGDGTIDVAEGSTFGVDLDGSKCVLKKMN